MDNWEAHSKLILYRLDELKSKSEELEHRQAEILNEVAGLKAKSRIWGSLAGGIASGVALVIHKFLA